MKWTAILLGLFLLYGEFAHGQAGSLDPSFGLGGLVTTPIRGHDQPNAMAIQNDGKIVVAGFTFTPWDFAIARYNTNGSLDPGFGSGGLVLTDFGSNDDAWALAIQPDGKILLAGQTWNLGGGSAAIARYMPNGSLDPTFGSGGKVVSSLGTIIVAMAVQTDGKILVGGTWGFSPQRKFLLARYNSNGSLDANFGSGGKLVSDLGQDAVLNAITLQTDGKILAAGAFFNNNEFDFALARYNANGSFDTNFSSDGRVGTNLGQDDIARSVAVQNDGKILVSGVSQISGNGNGNFALARYNSNGSLDSNFGSGGKVITSLGGDDDARGMAIAADGKIVLAGSTCCTNFAYDFALARYTPNGNLDHTFGSGGKVKTGFPQGDNDSATGVAIQTNGKIVAAGTSYGPNQNPDFAVVRYIGDAPPPPPPVCPQGQLFCDSFDDNSQSWDAEKGTWVESGGALNSDSADKKALVVAPASLAGCGRCSITTNLRISGVAGKASVLTHYLDKNNMMEVMFKLQNGSVLVKQRIDKQVVVKAKASLAIQPGVLYKVVAAFDGVNYTLTVNGNLLITLPVVGSPNGTIGYLSKSAAMIIEDVVVK